MGYFTLSTAVSVPRQENDEFGRIDELSGHTGCHPGPSSRSLTQGRINYTGVDRESKHKCGLTARFPGWKLRRRWNNFRGATSRTSQLQRWMWTSPSPPPAEWGLFPEKSKTKFKFQYPLNLWRGLLNFFFSRSGMIIKFAVCGETKGFADNQILRMLAWSTPVLPPCLRAD